MNSTKKQLLNKMRNDHEFKQAELSHQETLRKIDGINDIIEHLKTENALLKEEYRRLTGRDWAVQ
jgi:predicted nuclease with TOPRIM domain